MDEQAIQEYVTGFGRRFLEQDVLEKFPETKIIPAFLRQHFSGAETVLDLGFGTGIWFWASFLPSLKRIDGIEIYQQSLDEADRVLHLPQLPEGYAAAHEYLGDHYTLADFKRLEATRGHLLIANLLEPWSEQISRSRYDLVTEYGGLGEAESNQQFINVICRAGAVLKPGGSMLFVNFLEKQVTETEKKVGGNIPAGLKLGTPLFEHAAIRGGMKMIEFHEIECPEGMPNIQTFYYGYATKLS